MTIAVYKKTREAIDKAYSDKDKDLLEKETQFLLNSFVSQIPNVFSSIVRFVGIRDVELKSSDWFLTKEHQINMGAVLESLKDPGNLISDFAKVKVSFDKWFLDATVEGYIDYEYDSSFLVSVEHAAEMLQVSRQTVYKYLERGMEFKEINGVKKIPIVAIQLWKDTEYAFELQWIYQKNKIRKQSIEDKFEELQKQINDFELKYGDTFDHLYGELSNRQIDESDNAIDICDWKELVDQKNNILKKIKREI